MMMLWKEFRKYVQKASPVLKLNKPYLRQKKVILIESTSLWIEFFLVSETCKNDCDDEKISVLWTGVPGQPQSKIQNPASKMDKGELYTS
jgi:hypothetical protein